MSLGRFGLLVVILLVAPLAACRRDAGPSPVTTAVQARIDDRTAGAAVVWDDVRAFYQLRDHRAAWVGDNGRVAHEGAILDVLAQATAHGLPEGTPRAEWQATIQQVRDTKGDLPARSSAIADLDVRLTEALLGLGRQVALGATDPTGLDRRWKARRNPPDLAGILAALVEPGPREWLDKVQPTHGEYSRLKEALQILDGQRAKGGWPAVTPGGDRRQASLRPGAHAPAVVTLRARLAAGGHLTGHAATSQSPEYDSDVAAGVKAFQEHHSLKVNGVADAPTLAAMNVPIDRRLAQIALNLERWRWMPDDFGARHLLVNIPSYHVVARENGRDVMDIRVVVGKPGHETPVFSETMKTVVFSPYWNIPDTIAEGETVPALARDSKYLERNQIEVLRRTKGGVEAINARDVDWGDEDEVSSLTFRQKPGENNALGRVKFLFPNPYDVYLHDTPADALFSRVGRAFSHGCVRVEEPETLATYVLRGQADWPTPRILEAMNAGTEKAVTLAEPIPVHIVYFTAAVDAQGGIHVWDDVYGFDAKQMSLKARTR